MNKKQKQFIRKKFIFNKKGSMLVLSLVITSLFVVFSAAYLGLLVVEANNTEKTYRSNLALHLAESGAEEAIWQIKYNNSQFASADGWTGTNPTAKTASLATSSGKNLG